MGIYKPSPAVYQLAPAKMGVDKTAIGFVSSNSWDVIGAKTIGFWTCWVNRATATITVDRLTGFVDALRGDKTASLE